MLLRIAIRIYPWGALLALLIFTAGLRCWNFPDVFAGGRIFFVDADCYSRMTRVRQVVAHPGTVIHRHEFENWPEGTQPHTTAPFDYLTAGLTMALQATPAGQRNRQTALDLAGALVSPLLAVAAAAFLWFWKGRLGPRCRAPLLVLFATSPILVHGTVLGRPDHQSLLILCMAVALGAEAVLLRKPARGWAVAGGLAWGLGLWVSLYEPAVLLAWVAAFKTMATFRRPEPGYSRDLRSWTLSLLGVLLAALVIDGWPSPIPAPEIVRFFPNWSRTIGELVRVPPWSPVLFRWSLAILPLSPVLLGLAARRSGTTDADGHGESGRCAWFWLGLLLLTWALTCWQVRWGYFFALVFAMSLPWQLAVFPRRWMRAAVFAVALWPVAREWNDRLFPSETELGQRAEQRADNLALYDAARQLRGERRLPILAPWWQSPALAYWSGQPCVAGSSHESLPGIVDTCRFYLCEDPAAAQAILERRKVACVVVYEPTRVMETSRKILGVHPPGSASLPLGDPAEKAMGVLLFRRPHRPPPFLELVYGNLAFRVFLRPAGVE